ncbi:hypothetical protein C5167_028749 [Papaver somniferum]|uniref:putative leucine-rich repeat-containing protein DDB_G0290503 n=1 Tax=Papaver somniferum TaxID=3469 RepID=UPI000E702A9F|nr:putative leucine-rich repeat-containing protein DDB_G0290503 [Papaver somniferum]RZC90920.1 hypothetical protein C5167_028749 [Papaver somniferum]
MKPILLKAGIPIAFSFAGFILSMITTRKRIHSKSSSSHTSDETGSDSTNSEEEVVTNTHLLNPLVSLQIQDRPRLEEEMLGLKHLVNSFQNRELELERRFIRYCGLKEQELKVSQLQNLLELELAHVEFYKLMVEFIESENKRFGHMVVEYLKIGGRLESANTKNCLLEMKVKKLLSASKKYTHAASKQALMLRAKEAEVSRNQEKLEQKDNMINDLENEIQELKQILDRLEDEKSTLTEKLELAESEKSTLTEKLELAELEKNSLTAKSELAEICASSIPKIAEVSTAEHQEDQLLTELEQLRNLGYTCSTKNQEQESHEQEDKHNPLELNFKQKYEENDHHPGYDSDNYSIDTTNDESCTHITTDMNYQRKPKLLKKLKRWMIGHEKTSKGYSPTCNEEGEDYQNKCFGRHSVSYEANEQLVAGKKSSSSL